MNLEVVQKAIYSTGFFVFRDFVASSTAARLRGTWANMDPYEFHDFIPNKEVGPGTPPYVYNTPSERDFAYCIHVWNRPIDEELHEIAYRVQALRNQLEGRPAFYGLHESHGQALQYRVCRTVSDSAVVRPHADFFEEDRADPTGSHEFDPLRLQATLALSNYGEDYRGGGFKLWDDERGEVRTLGAEIEAKAGDLVLWRYSLRHEVSDVELVNRDVGYMRVIFPLFDVG